MEKVWIAAAVVGAVVVMLFWVVFLFLVSPFAIFVPTSESGNEGSAAMQEVVTEVNTAFAEKIEIVKQQYDYDEVVLQIDMVNEWKEILSVYAVKTMFDLDAESGREIVGSFYWDENQIQILSELYIDTHPIKATLEVVEPSPTTTSHSNTSTTTTATTTTETAHTTTTVPASKTILHIEVEELTLEEMAELYNFGDEQMIVLNALLSEDLDEAWAMLLSDIHFEGGVGTDLAGVARSQLGNIGGETYWRWYGFSSWVDWCACFASWCADQCGYIDSGVCPKFAGVNSAGIPWFRSRGLWEDAFYVPTPGEYMFVDWDLDGEADHVEIVVDVQNEMVYTIGGNRGGGRGACQESVFSVGSAYIFGYGTPQYPESTGGNSNE